ncbi:hypothetical protein Sjap_008534 [Stephania japonica]|uniref:Uncharacterized protein n=1 Tax=Stephania japonica TaxID=461633 RepID=A0AAP0JRZ0_9MAGN
MNRESHLKRYPQKWSRSRWLEKDFSAALLLSCRQEIMDLVNRSGKFSEKFERFTGMLLN